VWYLGKANRARLRYRGSQTSLKGREVLGRQDVTRFDSVQEASSSLTPCPLLWERPDNLLLDDNGSGHLWMKFAEVLELARLHERILAPLDLDAASFSLRS